MTRDQYEALLELLAFIVVNSPEFSSPENSVEAKKLGEWFIKQGRLQGVE
jgi:hypothetical protein